MLLFPRSSSILVNYSCNVFCCHQRYKQTAASLAIEFWQFPAPKKTFKSYFLSDSEFKLTAPVIHTTKKREERRRRLLNRDTPSLPSGLTLEKYELACDEEAFSDVHLERFIECKMAAEEKRLSDLRQIQEERKVARIAEKKAGMKRSTFQQIKALFSYSANGVSSDEIIEEALNSNTTELIEDTDSPYEINWQFYTQANADFHHHQVDQYFPELGAKGLQTIVIILITLAGLAALYAVQAATCYIYMKYSGILRVQIATAAIALATCGGMIWGYDAGTATSVLPRAQLIRVLSAVTLTAVGVTGITLAGSDYKVGYIATASGCLTGVCLLLHLKKLGLIQKWMRNYFVIIFTMCTISNAIGFARIPAVIDRAASVLYEEEIQTRLSLLSMLKRLLPASIFDTAAIGDL